MSRRTADWLAETIELLLGLVAVVFMFLWVPWSGLFEPHFGRQRDELAALQVAVLASIVAFLVAVGALVWMIRIYLRPEDEL